VDGGAVRRARERPLGAQVLLEELQQLSVVIEPRGLGQAEGRQRELAAVHPRSEGEPRARRGEREVTLHRRVLVGAVSPAAVRVERDAARARRLGVGVRAHEIDGLVWMEAREPHLITPSQEQRLRVHVGVVSAGGELGRARARPPFARDAHAVEERVEQRPHAPSKRDLAPSGERREEPLEPPGRGRREPREADQVERARPGVSEAALVEGAVELGPRAREPRELDPAWEGHVGVHVVRREERRHGPHGGVARGGQHVGRRAVVRDAERAHEARRPGLRDHVAHDLGVVGHLVGRPRPLPHAGRGARPAGVEVDPGVAGLDEARPRRGVEIEEPREPERVEPGLRVQRAQVAGRPHDGGTALVGARQVEIERQPRAVSHGHVERAASHAAPRRGSRRRQGPEPVTVERAHRARREDARREGKRGPWMLARSGRRLTRLGSTCPRRAP
jgi:hypothetical protein